MGDWEAVGRLEVVDIVVEVERLLSGVLVGIVELDGEPERAVLLHRGTHEQPPLKRWKPEIRQHSHSRLCIFFSIYCQIWTSFYSERKNSVGPGAK